MTAATHRSTVTVILPTYNRAAFLPAAFESITGQSWTDWDLVVVDDGSTDNTRAIVTSYAPALGDRLRYVYQENRGAYGARNRGLDEAVGDYVAFFDSDDLWLPHHLERCVTALQNHPDLDWAFGACTLVDRSTGRTLEPTTFLPGGRPRPFLNLRGDRSDGLCIITDPSVTECQILHGLYCGLQNSVMKRELFHGRRFNERSRVVDDEMFVIRVLSAGARFGYFMEPHVIYQVHDDNSSGSASGMSHQRRITLFTEMTESLEELLAQLSLNRREQRALRRRLGHEYFWNLGYSGFWQAGRHAEALEAFKRGLSFWPWRPAPWKTYLLARLKQLRAH
jgi:glycosyltransferase involved in cell wall biosynthesis